MGFRKSPRLAAEEVDEYLPSQDAPVYVAAAAASSENAMEEREGEGGGVREQRGVDWSRE